MAGGSDMISDISLFTVLLAAVIFDSSSGKIPNKLTIPALLLGLLFNYLQSSVTGAFQGVEGLFAGIAIFLIPWLLGFLGAGDVKLLAVVGSFKGPVFTCWCALFTALWGGVIALAVSLLRGETKESLKRAGLFIYRVFYLKMPVDVSDIHSGEKKSFFPYAGAIFLGALTAYLVKLL